MSEARTRSGRRSDRAGRSSGIPLTFELSTQRLEGVVQARAHGPGWHAETLRDGIGREVGPEAKDDGGAVLRAEAPESLADGVQLGRACEHVSIRDVGVLGQR